MCFWTRWTWRQVLVKEAENEQVIEGEKAFGFFSWGKRYKERGSDALFITAAQDTNSWIEEPNARGPAPCPGITNDLWAETGYVRDGRSRWQGTLGASQAMQALECQPEDAVIISEAIMSHWGSWVGRDMMKSVFWGRWIWQWCARSSYQLIPRQKSPLNQDCSKYYFGPCCTRIQRRPLLVSAGGCGMLILTAASCKKHEINAASRRLSCYSGSLPVPSASEANVYFWSVPVVSKSINAFVHLANIRSNLLCPGHHDRSFGYKKHKTHSVFSKNVYLIAVDILYRT